MNKKTVAPPREDWVYKVNTVSMDDSYSMKYVSWIGDKRTAKSRINIECKVCGLPTTSKVNNYTNKISKCKSCTRKGVTTRDLGKFVGYCYETQRGNTVKVEEVTHKDEYYTVHHIATCSICSLDEELFPYGSISVSDANIRENTCNCGCSASTSYSPNQYRTLINRAINKKGFTVRGIETVCVGSDTIDLTCLHCTTSWRHTTVSTLINTPRECPNCARVCAGESSRKSDEKGCEKFLATGKFPEGSIFTRSEIPNSKGHYTNWDMYCPLCSHDTYVQEGICNGVFTSSGANLSSGCIPCRCSHTHKWSTELRTHQLTNLCISIGGEFCDWETDSGYSGKKSRFNWICKEGHERNSSITSFTKKPTCGICTSGSGNGFYKDRIAEKDYLYVVICDGFIKVGRTFNLSVRFKAFKDRHGVKDLRVLRVYTNNHDTVFSIEQDTHYRLECKGFRRRDITWTSESFKLGSLDLVFDLLERTHLVRVHEPVW